MDQQPDCVEIGMAFKLGEVLLTGSRVHTREQFHAWMRGSLQELVPHDILICGFQDVTGHYRLEYFSSGPGLPPAHWEAICHPQHGLIAEGLRQWRLTCRPTLIGQEYAAGHFLGGDAEGWLARLGIGNLLTHAVRWIDGSIRCHIGFGRVAQSFDDRLAQSVEVLTPVLSATLARVLANESGGANKDRLLSPRELEILALVAGGGSNTEIAARLGVSPLTVKNHMRHILRKLNVGCRGEAVAKLHGMGQTNPAFDTCKSPNRAFASEF